MFKNKWLVCFLLMHVSFLSVAQGTDNRNFIKFSGIDFPLNDGYKINSDLFLDRDNDTQESLN